MGRTLPIVCMLFVTYDCNGKLADLCWKIIVGLIIWRCALVTS